MTKRKTLGVWRYVFAATALLPVAILADSPQPAAADPAAQQAVDQNIQQIKQQALDVEQQALAAEEDFLYPVRTRVNIYVGVLIPGMLIKDMTISVDGGAPVHYAYNEKESQVLQDGGLQRVLRINAEPGSHQIRAQFVAQYSDAKAGDPPFTGSLSASFDKTERTADIELALLREGFLTPPELRLKDWRPAS
jgi:hypothetical protein